MLISRNKLKIVGDVEEVLKKKKKNLCNRHYVAEHHIMKETTIKI